MNKCLTLDMLLSKTLAYLVTLSAVSLLGLTCNITAVFGCTTIYSSYEFRRIAASPMHIIGAAH